MKLSFFEIKSKIEKNEILSNLLYILFGFLLAYFMYFGLGVFLGTQNPVVTVVSDSMLPVLERGDLLVLTGVSGEQDLAFGRQNGTIIVYFQPALKKLVVHRLYAKNTDGTYLTWGDNNPTADPWSVEPEWIRGKLFLRIPYLGYPRILLSEILGTAS